MTLYTRNKNREKVKFCLCCKKEMYNVHSNRKYCLSCLECHENICDKLRLIINKQNQRYYRLKKKYDKK